MCGPVEEVAAVRRFCSGSASLAQGAGDIVLRRMAIDERGWEAAERILRWIAGGTPPAVLVSSSGEIVLAGVVHGRLDGIDQGHGAGVDVGHADAERLRVVTLRVPPAGDVIGGAER
jgi:hypothetical protein